MIYTSYVPLAGRSRVLKVVQRREVVIVGIRSLVELIANDPTARGHTLLMLLR